MSEWTSGPKNMRARGKIGAEALNVSEMIAWAQEVYPPRQLRRSLTKDPRVALSYIYYVHYLCHGAC